MPGTPDFIPVQQQAPPDFFPVGGSAALKTSENSDEPGLLDKNIPLSGSWYNPTLSGVQSIGRGVRGAAQGLYNTILHPIDTAIATAHSIADIPSTIAQVPGAIHDINASPDPTGTYAKAAQETAGQGAGQAILALGTEGLVKGVPAAARIAKPAITGAARVASDVIDPDLMGIVSPRLAHVQRIAGRVADALDKKPAPDLELDATGENKPYAGAPRPKLEKELDATGENRPHAGGMDEYTPPKKPVQSAPAAASPSRIALPVTELEKPVLGRAAEMTNKYPVQAGALASPERILSPIESTPSAQPSANTAEATGWHNQALQMAKEKLGPQAPLGSILQEAAKIQQAGPSVIAPEFSPEAQNILGRLGKNAEQIRAADAARATEPDDLSKMLESPDFIERSVEAVKAKRLAAQKAAIIQ